MPHDPQPPARKPWFYVDTIPVVVTVTLTVLTMWQSRRMTLDPKAHSTLFKKMFDPSIWLIPAATLVTGSVGQWLLRYREERDVERRQAEIIRVETHQHEILQKTQQSELLETYKSKADAALKNEKYYLAAFHFEQVYRLLLSLSPDISSTLGEQQKAQCLYQWVLSEYLLGRLLQAKAWLDQHLLGINNTITEKVHVLNMAGVINYRLSGLAAQSQGDVEELRTRAEQYFKESLQLDKTQVYPLFFLQFFKGNDDFLIRNLPVPSVNPSPSLDFALVPHPALSVAIIDICTQAHARQKKWEMVVALSEYRIAALKLDPTRLQELAGLHLQVAKAYQELQKKATEIVEIPIIPMGEAQKLGTLQISSGDLAAQLEARCHLVKSCLEAEVDLEEKTPDAELIRSNHRALNVQYKALQAGLAELKEQSVVHSDTVAAEGGAYSAATMVFDQRLADLPGPSNLPDPNS